MQEAVNDQLSVESVSSHPPQNPHHPKDSNLIRRLSCSTRILIITMIDEMKKNAQITLKTIALSFCFMAAGMSSAIAGPTLLDLQTQTATTMDKISLILTSRALGMGVGALLSGAVYPKVNFLLSTSIASLIASVSTIAIGHVHEINHMLAAFAVNGVCLGMLEGGSTVFVFQMWGKEAMPFIQAAYFMFGLGALAAPLLSEPFLLIREPGDLFEDVEFGGYHVAHEHSSHTEGQKYNLIVPYSVLSGFMFCNAIVMLVIWLRYPATPEHPSRMIVDVNGEKNKDVNSGEAGAEQVTQTPDKGQDKTYWKVVVIMLHMIEIHLYFGIYVGLASYLVTFVVTSDLHLSKTTGSHMTTMYWSTFTFTKLAAIMYIPLIGNRNSILLGLSVIIAGNAILIPFADTSEIALWLAVAMIGAGLSAIYACMLRYLEGFFPITSTIGSLTSVAGVLGEFTFPAIISLLIDRNPFIIIWVIAASSLAMAILFPLIMIICNLKLKK